MRTMSFAVLFSLVFSACFSGCGVSCSLSEPTQTMEKELLSISPGTDDSQEPKLISIKVTGMMCPHSCLKDVKSLIEKQNDVVSIELTPQKEADVIDNPVVLVRYKGELHQEATTKAILAAGFEKVEFAAPTN
jgi:hypothetical protein